jgi:uncharacterized OsmC-like protein
MVHMSIVYEGDKHCQLTHSPSKSTIQTDAPRDNNGRGEAFSPTDLVGAALGSCILTTMAIFFEKEGLVLKGARAEVEKEMVSDPRRIGALHLKIHMPAGIARERRAALEKIAHDCPVSRSLNPELKIPLQIIYPD